MTIGVGNLSYQVTQEDLKEVFAYAVKSLIVPTDRETGKLRGFAFMEMVEVPQEDAAISKGWGVRCE